MLKKLLDGIVFGLQGDSDPDAEAVRRLSQRMSLSENLVTAPYCTREYCIRVALAAAVCASRLSAVESRR